MQEDIIKYTGLRSDASCPKGCKDLDSLHLSWRCGQIQFSQMQQAFTVVLAQMCKDLASLAGSEELSLSWLEYAQRAYVHTTMRVCVVEHTPWEGQILVGMLLGEPSDENVKELFRESRIPTVPEVRVDPADMLGLTLGTLKKKIQETRASLGLPPFWWNASW